MLNKILFLFLCTVLFLNVTSAQILTSDPVWQSIEEDVYSTGMIWRDVNLDGYIDLFISNGNDIVLAPNFIYISKYGTLPTSASWVGSNGEYSGHCAVGDLDDNGYPDFVVSNFLGSGGFSTPNRSNIYYNDNGYPDRTPAWFSPDSFYSFSCALGDIDNDGDLDLAFAAGEAYNSHPDYDYIYENVDGTYNPVPIWKSQWPNQSLDVTFGDVDNDGDLDMAFCDQAGGAYVYYNDGGIIEISPSWESFIDNSANTVIFGDITGDGWLDLIVAYNSQLGGDGKFRVYNNDGTGNLSYMASWTSATGGYGSAVAIYDYDNDGDNDLAAGRWFNGAYVYENNGGTLNANPTWDGLPSSVVEELAWVDVDGDGVEQFVDTINVIGSKKLYYLSHHTLFSIDSVYADGSPLTNSDYCYDLIGGWISLKNLPLQNTTVYYKYSYKNDLAASNWDTHNMVFGNTRNPFVEFSADITIGEAPLTVSFANESSGYFSSFWRFGDGSESNDDTPIHAYAEGGAYDVYLSTEVADGPHNRTKLKMIRVLADTVIFPDLEFGVGDTIKIPVYLRNSQPMKSLVLPISYGGPLDLRYLSFDTDSCATTYFDDVRSTAVAPQIDRAAFLFQSSFDGSKPPLEPGYHRIINLYFKNNSFGDFNMLDTSSLSGQSFQLLAGYIDYIPKVVPGMLSATLAAKGDCDENGTIDLLDILFLIDFKYRDGPAPGIYQADVNCDGLINLLDILFLIDYKFKGGPSPDCA